MVSEYQIPVTNFLGNVKQLEGRINNQILRVKRFRLRNLPFQPSFIPNLQYEATKDIQGC